MTSAGRCILASGLALFPFLACGGDDSDPPETKPEWTTEMSPGPAQRGIPKPGEPALPPVTKSSELPAQFPKDVPHHPEAQVKSSRGSPGAGMSVSLVVEQEPDQVVSYYADGFAAQGWSTDIRRTPEGDAIFADKDNRTVSAVVRPGGAGTLVDLVLVER